MMADKELNYESEREGDPVIYAIEDLAKIDNTVAQDKQKVLEDRFFSRSAQEIGEETEFDESTYYA